MSFLCSLVYRIYLDIFMSVDGNNQAAQSKPIPSICFCGEKVRVAWHQIINIYELCKSSLDLTLFHLVDHWISTVWSFRQEISIFWIRRVRLLTHIYRQLRRHLKKNSEESIVFNHCMHRYAGKMRLHKEYQHISNAHRRISKFIILLHTGLLGSVF